MHIALCEKLKSIDSQRGFKGFKDARIGIEPRNSDCTTHPFLLHGLHKVETCAFDQRALKHGLIMVVEYVFHLPFFVL